ncbi:MAG: SDR family NAD(P)-dependent oxidoreductase [Phycisphaeraceae bacterium]
MGRDLRDKVIVITGASSGIGAATAVACAAAGMDVAIAARREVRLRDVAGRIEQLGRRVVTVRCDVAEDGDVAHLFERAWAELGRVDVAFANAGYGLASSVLDTTDEQHRAIFEVNYFGTLRVVREAVPYLRRTGNGLGHLLICSSAASEIGLPWFGAYSATKAAQDCIAGALRSELQDEVEVTSVHPVGTKTDFFDTAEQMAGGDGPGMVNTPGLFTQTPEKVARKIVAALRRPRAEVWPLGIARLGLGLATILPGLTNRVLKWESRGKDPKQNRISVPSASPSQPEPEPQETTHESP